MAVIFNINFGLLLYVAILLTLVAVVLLKMYFLLSQKNNDLKTATNPLASTQFNQEVEAQVRQRTSILEHKNKDLENFNYVVSHDLKAPLKNIKGLATILKAEVQKEQQISITHIVTMTTRMERLINKLLLFSKVKQLSVQKEVFNLEKLMKECYEDMKKDFPHKKIVFDLQPLPPAYGDKAAIRQVCQNLLSNALKYASKKKTIHLSVFASSKNKQLVVGLKDNGTGFDETQKDKLFQRFQRLHKSSEYEGTGLGLVICQQIIEKHNGKIWAENNRTTGATFYFSLPLAPVGRKRKKSSAKKLVSGDGL